MFIKSIIVALCAAAGPLHGQVILLEPPLRSAAQGRVMETSSVAIAVTTPRTRHVRVGAVTGALIGALAGVVAGAKLPVGCDVGGCHKPNARIKAVVGLGVVGAATGAALGALVGLVMPSESPGSNKTSIGPPNVCSLPRSADEAGVATHASSTA
jgi:hypothetical protein